MADMPVSNGIFTLNVSAAGSGSRTVLLATENKFVDKNISVKFDVAAAATPHLVMTDSSRAVDVGTASEGVYPLTNNIAGKTTYSTAGWIGTNGLDPVTQDNVQVGTITQSTMSIGNTTLATGGAVVPSVTASQTITISEGYEHARTIIVSPMSAGTPAAATVAGTKAATTPTLANTASAQDGKTQITVSPTTATSGINKYYLALTANAPATNFAASNFTKTINTVGYLDNGNQITVADNAVKTTQSSKIYYVPITSGAASVNVSAAAAIPTASSSNASLSGKTALTGTPTSSSSGISTYYIPFTVNAPATTFAAANITKTISTNGYIDNADQISVSASTTSTTATYYMPITSGELKANAGSVDADPSVGGVIGTVQSTAPTGYYIEITGSGQAGVQTAGWIPTTATQNSQTATKYIALNTAALSQNQATGTISISEGYVPEGGLSLEVTRGTINSGASSKSGYANNDTVVPANGYLYINAGYHPNTQISLATLIPDDTEYTNATTNQMLFGYEAYDTNGNKLIGTITTYTGTYTLS